MKKKNKPINQARSSNIQIGPEMSHQIIILIKKVDFLIWDVQKLRILNIKSNFTRISFY